MLELREIQESVTSGTLAIQVKHLHKSYPNKKAVDGISFGVVQGEIFGILGPNGAGKSTALEMIEGLRQPDVHPDTALIVDGLDVQNPKQRKELHQRIGLQLQTSSLFEELSVRENLEMLAMLYRKARPVNQLLKEFDLEQKAKAGLGTLSGGQQQRVALAAALINDPTIVFLDEPTTALDPQARRNVWSSIRALQQAGKTVILTTHYMEEAEVLCNRVAIMDNGQIVALGTPAQLIQQYATEQTIICRFEGKAIEANLLSHLKAVTNVLPHGNRVTLHTTNLAETMIALLYTVEQNGLPLAEITTHSPGLEDVFLNLTGKQLRD
ncbi:MAG: ATP-binding cassette domain-containing protein [Chloroflexota bacterium]|nr:ATP-binding cassette domain-containing protein [Chloroflexota bacterium]